MRVLLRSAVDLPRLDGAESPIDFHRRLSGYRETELRDAPRLAARLGIGRVLVKDETARFGLPSFKILGASWAVYVALRDILVPIDDGPLTVDRLKQWAAPARSQVLLAATDGNHGRAVARVARWFGLKARIFVPDFVSAGRRAAIEAEGAELIVIEGPYDAAVEAAIEASAAVDCLLITDTARAVDEVMPQHVTAGYSTAFVEVERRMSGVHGGQIDVVAVQAGVGGLATAATRWARAARRAGAPRVAVVEPESAACVMAALAAGEPVTVSATASTAMSCLQCGTISLTAFETLMAGVSACIAVEDYWAAAGVEALEAEALRVGPSGAGGVAGLMAAMSGPLAPSVREHLKLSSDSNVLIVATESADVARQVEQAEMVPA